MPAAEQVRQPAVISQLTSGREDGIAGLAVLGRHQLGIIAPDHNPVLVVLTHDPGVLASPQLPVIECIKVEGKPVRGRHRRLPVIPVRGAGARVVGRRGGQDNLRRRGGLFTGA
jgi:hypothetical protein